MGVGSRLLECAGRTFGDAEVAIDAVVSLDGDVVFGAVVGFFEAIAGANVSAFEAGIAFFDIDRDSHE